MSEDKFVGINKVGEKGQIVIPKSNGHIQNKQGLNYSSLR